LHTCIVTFRLFLDKWLSSRTLAVGLLIIAIGLVVGSKVNRNSIVQDYIPNIVTEIISIAVTVLIIDSLNERRSRKELKDRLKRQIWSKDQGLALNAINELRANGWLTDGSLEDINLPYAVLDRAELKEAVLNGANFHRASLRKAYVGHAHLRNCDFSQADLTLSIFNHSDLTGSDFTNAILDDASFEDAILMGATIEREQILCAKSFRGAIMPDGSSYEEWLKKGINDA